MFRLNQACTPSMGLVDPVQMPPPSIPPYSLLLHILLLLKFIILSNPSLPPPPPLPLALLPDNHIIRARQKYARTGKDTLLDIRIPSLDRALEHEGQVSKRRGDQGHIEIHPLVSSSTKERRSPPLS